MISIKKVLSKLANDNALTEKKTLLWTNPNPSADFATQTIDSTKSGWVGPSDLSGYDYIEIYLSNEDYIKRTISNKKYTYGFTQNVSVTGSGIAIYERMMQVNTSGITFDDAYFRWIGGGNTPSVSNNQIKPLKIYGIKLGGGYLTNLLNLLRNKEVFA